MHILYRSATCSRDEDCSHGDYVCCLMTTLAKIILKERNSVILSLNFILHSSYYDFYFIDKKLYLNFNADYYNISTVAPAQVLFIECSFCSHFLAILFLSIINNIRIFSAGD